MPVFNGNVVIASIFPLATYKAERPYGNGETTAHTSYQIPAVAKGDVKTLVVYDAFEMYEDWSQAAEGQAPPKRPLPVWAEHIAKDLMGHWTTSLMDVSEIASPGIMIVARNAPDPDSVRPTAEQLMRMKMLQTAYFQILFYDGNRLANEHKNAQITPLHIIAAKWIGKDVDWAEKIGVDEMMPCPACTTKINSMASICPNCRTQIKAMPADLASLQGEVLQPAGA
jgi:hypothetical protein